MPNRKLKKGFEFKKKDFLTRLRQMFSSCIPRIKKRLVV